MKQNAPQSFTGYGCIHPTAVIGSPPQHRAFNPAEEETYEPYVSPTAWVGAYCTIDSGRGRTTTIGDSVMLMHCVHVGHDVIIGEGTEIAPMTSIGGWVVIGKRVSIGQGVTIKNRITIGDGAVLGMGAVVIRDVPPGVTVVGNPAGQLLRGPGPRRRQQELNALATGEVLAPAEVEGWEEYAAGSQL